jgi:hypothetical protein
MSDPKDSAGTARPRLVQRSSAPMFRGSGVVEFTCIQCGHLLVEGYQPRQLLAIDLQCWRCGAVSRTANWPDDEPLPHALATIGSVGVYNIGSTVDMRVGGGAVSCDQEIARVRARTGIQAEATTGIDLTDDGFAKLEVRLRLLCDGFDTCLKRTRTAFARGNTLFMDFPPAWAFLHLKKSIASGHVDLRGADGVALAYLQIVLVVLSRWQHVDRFPAIQAALLYEFHHSIAQMVFATYMADAGNDIGFSAPHKEGGRSPDLFINGDAFARHSLEVKAPRDLQWPNPAPNAGRLQRIIEAKLKESRGQIESQGGGVLVIGASVADPQFRQLSEQVVRALVESGRVPSRISAIAVVNIARHSTITATSPLLYVSTEWDVFAVSNPRYAGDFRLEVD